MVETRWEGQSRPLTLTSIPSNRFQLFGGLGGEGGSPDVPKPGICPVCPVESSPVGRACVTLPGTTRMASLMSKPPQRSPFWPEELFNCKAFREREKEQQSCVEFLFPMPVHMPIIFLITTHSLWPKVKKKQKQRINKELCLSTELYYRSLQWLQHWESHAPFFHHSLMRTWSPAYMVLYLGSIRLFSWREIPFTLCSHIRGPLKIMPKETSCAIRFSVSAGTFRNLLGIV